MGAESLLTDSHISERSTGMSDSAIRTGAFPNLLGLETVEVTTGLGDYEAVIVDRDRYGYEAEEDLLDSISSYRLEEKDGTAYKVRRWTGYKAMDADAAVHIQG